MSTLPKINEFLKLVSSKFKDKHLGQLKFGFQAVSLLPIHSLNSNARTTVINQHTAESKIFRLCKSQSLPAVFPDLISALGLIHEHDIANIDFSDFGMDKQVLMFAKQTKYGRAVPLYFETIQYPIKKGSQNLFIVEVINHFFQYVPHSVKLVLDRGFAIPYLIKKLLENQHVFYIRIKKDKQVKRLEKSTLKKVKTLKNNDEIVEIYEARLRVVRSSKPKNGNEPWYIVTNDFNSTRDQILDIYYHRFEIEEFFKDAKRFFRLEYLRTKTIQSFSVVLWFVILGHWLAWYLHQTLGKGKRFVRKLTQGFSVNIIQSWLERILQEMRSSFLSRLKLSSHGRV